MLKRFPQAVRAGVIVVAMRMFAVIVVMIVMRMIMAMIVFVARIVRMVVIVVPTIGGVGVCRHIFVAFTRGA